ncbi:MAG TPA: hypothetical protein ENG43_00955 [Candidatus Bathyarchaeota archaeon]|nr:hypothetical protein [Candidatus Bathyarchaeota archaeon]HEW89897.1 hypothetical protein [Candidatus Bathyarchaeota archaeon]
MRPALDPRTRRALAAYGSVMGLAYVIIGLLEVVNAFYTWFLRPGAEEALIALPGLPAGDLFGGFSSLVIGLVLLQAIRLWRPRRDEDVAFVLVGSLLAAAFGVLYILIFIANGLSALLAGGEELADWLASGWLADVLRPEIWLFVLVLPAAIVSWRATRIIVGEEGVRG